MKPAKIYQQYIWIISMLRQYKRLSLEELSALWVNNKVIGGEPLNRKSFIRHKDAILNMFGIVIECDLKHGYKYYIANPEVVNDDSIEGWMLSTLTVGSVLSDGASLRDRILLENVPAGEEYLQPIIQALKANRRITITYQRFGCESGEKTIAPLSLKLHRQRWYLLSHTGNHFATYSLDRMQSLQLTDEKFEMPAGFSAEDYFKEYFGVLTDETPLEHVVIRAYGKTVNYLRTLPLHASQKEISQNEAYSDFVLDIRPTIDFIGELLKNAEGIEVLEPADLRQKVSDILKATRSRYD